MYNPTDSRSTPRMEPGLETPVPPPCRLCSAAGAGSRWTLFVNECELEMRLVPPLCRQSPPAPLQMRRCFTLDADD
uniref:Uncharacterized protein n=1 Tax=Knipowitschia caucasica TaxID=637954 RepID=A0AAV2JUZ1_KNICA